MLEEPLSIEEIEQFCKQFYPEEPYCLNQAMFMYIIPLPANLGRFIPLPEAIVDPEVIFTPEEHESGGVDIEES